MNKIRKSPLIITKLNLISTVTLLKFTHHLFLSRQFSFFFFLFHWRKQPFREISNLPVGLYWDRYCMLAVFFWVSFFEIKFLLVCCTANVHVWHGLIPKGTMLLSAQTCQEEELRTLRPIAPPSSTSGARKSENAAVS